MLVDSMETMTVVNLRDSQPSMPGRVPPHNLAAEESLLGAMLLTKEAIAEAVEVVSADHFYKPAHQHVFTAIMSLYNTGEPVDTVTVAPISATRPPTTSPALWTRPNR